MKNFKKCFILLPIIILLVSLIYCLYPKSGPLNSFIFKHCNEENITKIRMTRSYDDKYISIKDINEINKLLSDLSKVKIVEYKENINTRSNCYYDFAISTDKTHNILEIIFYDTNYITIDNLKDHNMKTYKIIDNSLDKEYMKGLIKEKSLLIN